MIKHLFIMGLLVIIVSSQTTVTPKTQACACADLLSQADCNAKTGCTWKFSTTTNSTTNITITSSTSGTCSNSTTVLIPTSPTSPTYCLNVKVPLCSQTIGCAFINNICTIFAGCSAYVQQTNEGCQAISTQCTTDGIRCTTPTACSTYTTQALCSGNIATTGAKSCNWTPNGSAGTCVDKVCSDAPATYTTQQQCAGWITGCLTNGRGCATTLGACNSYTQANGCTGMIGLDGTCTSNTSEGSTVCRLLQCSDAAINLATDKACSAFLTGCVTTVKGCVQTLQACSSYPQAQGCRGLIGIDRPCTLNTTGDSIGCRALACTDASTSLKKDEDCINFLAGCFTTGQGCINILGLCSSYTGTTQTCSSYIGTDGNCKGTSATQTLCSARACEDAPTTTNTDSDCGAFQVGCITNGFGCVKTLGLCKSYKGTNVTCVKYIGSDGNCTAPPSQTSPADCAAKVCSEAPQSKTTKCQDYSYKCVSNGNGCVEQASQGSSSCISNQICVDSSKCESYINQSQCLLNQQQYQSGGKVYQRACMWSAGACSKQVCGDLSRSLANDDDCNKALAGCLSNGKGCVDVNDGCGSYAGLTETCLKFKGTNGTQLCTQSNKITNSASACVARTLCSQAKSYNLDSVTYSQDNCDLFLSGCFYDGKDNCTNGDCTSYFGKQSFCGSIKTALSGTTPVYCWKTYDLDNPDSACEEKQCGHAKGLSFLSNEQCNQFLKGCFWTGQAAGGCSAPSTACASYLGTISTCAEISESNKICTKTVRTCREFDCSLKSPPSTATAIIKGEYCQGFIDKNGNNCKMGIGYTCVSSETGCTQFLAIGEDNDAKAKYCNGLRYPRIKGQPLCGYTQGDYCDTAECDKFTPSGVTADEKAISCQGLQIDGVIQCGLATSTATHCSERNCFDYGMTYDLCYTVSGCKWNSFNSICYNRYTCGNNIPQLTSSQKADYCSSFKIEIRINSYSYYCGYDISSNTCITAKDTCFDIEIPESIKENQDKASFCASSKYKYGGNCAYSAGSTTCIPLDFCDKYIPYQGDAPDNLVSQSFCSALRDSQGYVCGFTSGTARCVAPQSTCESYNTYGTTIKENQNLCSNLQIKNSYSYCASNTAGNSKCKEPDCADITTDQSLKTCQDYNSNCVFDGLTCVARQRNCSNYIAQSVGGQFHNCSRLYSQSGICGWDMVAQSKNCQSRSCSQLTGEGANAQACSQYFGCQYDGYGCVEWKSYCTSYIPQGESDTINASICNAMNSYYGKCTYMVGTSTCIETLASCAYDKPASAKTDAEAQAACILVQDDQGNKCGYTPGIQQCSPRACIQILTASLDSDCSSYAPGCELDATTPCASTDCTSAPKSYKKNDACESFRTGCITNGAGCVENTECSNLKGTQDICNGLTGKGVPCTNESTAGTDDACKDRTCKMNTTAKSDDECKTWYPPTSGVANCVWGGSSGCVPPQLCAEFTGTVDSCPIFKAKNGPCHGTGTVAEPSPCIANNSDCKAAPTNYNTDTQCKSWGSTCMTNGFGCISTDGATCSSILSPLACPLYKSTTGLFCDLANECRTKPSTCDGFSNQQECNSTPLLGSTKISCAWDAASKKCIPLTCALLSAKLMTDDDCSAIIPTCTTNGAGCITKDACSTYPKQACGPAATTDTQKACIWSDSVCRPIKCTDNVVSSSDADCNKYLAGCKTTGTGCAETLTCSLITKAAFCLSDSTGYPCLWYIAQANVAGKCINYAQCSDIISPSHAACQAASPFCTTNGTNCIAITGCSSTILQASCIIGTDGICGWLPAAGSTAAGCTLFTNCQVAKGTTSAECQAWGLSCIYDGTTCLTQSICSAYTTQIACRNPGTDGACLWVASTGISTSGTCRQQQCSDATTNTSTHTGCAAFSASTTCTTSGTACIAQAPCSTYSLQEGCVQGTDGVCVWATSATSNTPVCRLKQCTDMQLTTSEFCAKAIKGVKCVSNGSTCIAQSTCSTYKSKEACLGGGSDGACAFTPGTNSQGPNQGTCELFSSCATANSDKIACNSRSDVCYFNETIKNGMNISSCQPHTCATKALGSSCQPVPSWDLSTYQICILIGSSCSAGSPSSFTALSCYSKSVGTYSWNANSSSCTACVSKTTIATNSTNSTVNNTISTYGYIISIILQLALFV